MTRAILLLAPVGSRKHVVARALHHQGTPFRAPHYSVSEAGLVGILRTIHQTSDDGVTRTTRTTFDAYQGEAALADGGTLVLDAVAEFQRGAIEGLGRVLRAGEAVFTAGDETIRHPARPALLILMSSLCPCAYLGTDRPCVCSRQAVGRWTSRIAYFSDLLGVTEIVPVERLDLADLKK